MTWLLDGNLLAAYAILTHHARVHAWFANLTDRFATCAATQGTLLRLHMQLAQDTSATVAWTELRGISNHPRHEFWDDGFSYLIVPTHPLQGHRQVTDTWLAELARRHGGRLATLDQGLAATHSDVAVLIP